MSRRRGRAGRDGSGDAKEPAVKCVTPNKVLSRLPSRRGMVGPLDEVAHTGTKSTLSKNALNPVLGGRTRGEGPVVEGGVSRCMGCATANPELDANREPKADADAVRARARERTAVGNAGGDESEAGGNMRRDERGRRSHHRNQRGQGQKREGAQAAHPGQVAPRESLRTFPNLN